jgi:hypothetical protein
MTISSARSLSLVVSLFALGGAAALACGGKEPPKTPDAVASASAASSGAAAGVTSAVASASAAGAAPSASASASAGPAAPKASFVSAARAPTSGKVDKVGERDGDFKPDKVKDLVIDVEYDGPAVAFYLASTDKEGTPTGDFEADTLVGNQEFPPEIAPTLNGGKYTAGIAVFEGEKLLNAKDGSLPALPEGKHKLALHVSSKNAPTGALRIFASLADKSVVKSAIVK